MDRAGQAGGSTDVTIFNAVNVTFGTNPVGATFAGGGSQLQVDMVQGVVDFSDIQIMKGGSGFTLRFSVADAHGDVLEVESDPFHCGGQEARLAIVQQPILTLEGSRSRMTPPIIHVVDPYSKRLELANPVINVGMFYNPGDAGLGASQTAVRASKGVAVVDQVYLSRAATEVESDLPQHLLDTKSTKNRLRISSPGFPDVISEDFETLPLLSIEDQPVSDLSRVVTRTCSGNSSGCLVVVSGYLNTNPDGTVKDKLQTAHLHVDIACTDLDGPDEFVTSVAVGNRKLQPGVQFETGPWDECGFAGCREQCDSNMRRVVSGLNVKDDVGSYDPVTRLYKSMGAPLRVHVAITDKVNICNCDGQPLKIKVQLVVTYAQAAEDQGSPMRQQPRVLLLNADGTLYTLRQKYVMVTYATDGADPFDAISAFGNPSGAQLTGNTRVLSKDGVALFTDLAVTEGAKGYVLRFHVRGVFNVNSTSVIDSEAFNVGCGNFPQLTLDCVDCSRPAPSRQEARSLSQPPQLELLKTRADGSQVKSASYLQVHMSFGMNGPAGMFSGDSRTVRNADGGSVKFADVTIYNGNCAFCPNQVCGDGYTLYFIANDVALESQEFDIAGGNRSPKFIAPTPAAGTVYRGVMAVPRHMFTLNMTDDNHDEILLSLRSAQGSSVSCQPATCMTELNGAVLWGEEVEFVPQVEDDECSRPLFAGNGPSYPADGLYWGMYADMTYAPTCEQAAANYPPLLGEARAVEDVCFMPSDKVTRVDPPISTNGEERCFRVQIATPVAPYFTQPFKMNHTQAGIADIAEPSAHEAATIAAHASALEFPAPPLPSYVPPHAAGDDVEEATLGKDFGSLYVGVGCRMVVPLAAAEVQARVLSNGAVQTELRVQALRTTRSSLYGQQQLAQPLPEGARVAEGPLANPHVSSFEWEPTRGQEGYVYTVCFEIVTELSTGCQQRFYTAPYHGHLAQYCLDIHVERCKYCMRSGESLEGLARAWRTAVPQLWAGNPALLRPDDLQVGTLLHLGIAYTADVDDQLPRLAQLAGRTVAEVLEWNPDLPADDLKLLAGEDVLISAATRYEHRQAPWAVQNGTFVADSQTVCLLPNICLYAPIPEGGVSIGTASFDCRMCETGAAFCTGAICVMGEGEGPWAPDKCTKYLGSRCERCAACQQEQFDVDGHIAVRGTWRSGGCDGMRAPSGVAAAMAEEDNYVTCTDCTLDSTCTDCTVCSDGEIETAPCTPFSDRVCVESGATKGPSGKLVPPPGYSGSFLPAPK